MPIPIRSLRFNELFLIYHRCLPKWQGRRGILPPSRRSYSSILLTARARTFPMKCLLDANDVNCVHYKLALDLNTDLGLKATTDILTNISSEFITTSSRNTFLYIRTWSIWHFSNEQLFKILKISFILMQKDKIKNLKIRKLERIKTSSC